MFKDKILMKPIYQNFIAFENLNQINSVLNHYQQKISKNKKKKVNTKTKHMLKIIQQ